MRLAIFDLDGTLIDSVALIVETVVASFNAAGHTVPDEKAIRAISGITAREALGILAPGVEPVQVDRIMDIYREEYLKRAGVGREPLFRGAIAALDRLQSDPETVLAVATGKGYNGAVTLLESHGIIERFNSIQTPDHNRGKPDPQMIETAMRKAGIDRSATVMIGDTVHDMRMARAASVGAIGVAWGYHEIVELEEAGAHIVLQSFDDLDAAITKLVG
jgi:phosphoglycolate phosphatase